MSDDRDLEPKDFDELARLLSGDPRRRLLEPQARLRARARAFEEFESPGNVPEGARLAEAETRLAESLQRELGVPIRREAWVPEGRANQSVRLPARGRRRVTPGPFWAPALAAAVLIVVVGGAWMLLTRPNPQTTPIMRGETPRSPAGTLTGTSRVDEGGNVRFEWTATTEATTFVVTILAPDLTEMTRLEPVTVTHTQLAPGALDTSLVPEGQLLWRVTALRGTDEIARSSMMPLTLPR